MAEDLAGTPVPGLDVWLCGDAHLANFGMIGSPERTLLFDINDFGETYPGPWEWELKRLAGLPQAIADFAHSYADLDEQDFATFSAALARGVLAEAATGTV